MTRASPSRRVHAAPSEAQIQRALFDWLALHTDGRQHAFHIPNEGKRSIVGGALLKRAGLKKGASDVFVPVAAGGWNGMFLEIKAKGKKLNAYQIQFADAMSAQGYFATWADNLDHAMTLVESYVAGHYCRANWVHYAAPAKRA